MLSGRRAKKVVEGCDVEPAERVQGILVLAELLLMEIESIGLDDRLKGHLRKEDELCLADRIRRFEVDLIRNTLIRARGRKADAARLLGTKLTTLHEKIKRYGIEVEGLDIKPGRRKR